MPCSKPPRASSEDDLFTYIYTSGTTGPPKACMIRHRNYYEMVAVVDELEDFTIADDLMLLYLPLAHNFGRLMHLSGPYVGFTIAFLARSAAHGRGAAPGAADGAAERAARLREGARGGAARSSTRRPARSGGSSTGRCASAARSARCGSAAQPIPRALELQRRVARQARLREGDASGSAAGCGSRISGGAPLAQEIAEFFDALGITILEGYGLTECTSAATVNRIGRYRLGTVGPALPGTELTPRRRRRAA